MEKGKEPGRKKTEAQSATAPRRKLTQAERTARSDARMFEAAVQLLLTKGTHNLLLREVGEMAGYSRGLASLRFGSKGALFSELTVLLNKRWAEELKQFVGGRTGLSALLAGVDAVEDFFSGQPNYARALYVLYYESITAHESLTAELAANHIRQRRDVQRWITEGIAERFIRPGIDPERFAVQHCSFLFGAVYQWLVNPEVIHLKSVFKDYKEMIVNTIGERRAGSR